MQERSEPLEPSAGTITNSGRPRTPLKSSCIHLPSPNPDAFHYSPPPHCSIVPLMGLNFMAYDVLMGYMGGEGMGKVGRANLPIGP